MAFPRSIPIGLGGLSSDKTALRAKPGKCAPPVLLRKTSVEQEQGFHSRGAFERQDWQAAWLAISCARREQTLPQLPPEARSAG